MRKIVASFAASVDGYIEGPGGECDWISIDDKTTDSTFQSRFDTFLYGRYTYEAALVLNLLPTPGNTHFVFSHSLQSVAPGFLLVNGSSKAKLAALKQENGKDIAVQGGAGLLSFLLNECLIDEISILFVPVLLGGGKPMVSILNKRVRLHFISSRRYPNGTLNVHYKVSYNGAE